MMLRKHEALMLQKHFYNITKVVYYNTYDVLRMFKMKMLYNVLKMFE